MNKGSVTIFLKLAHKLKGLRNVYAKKSYSQCGEDMIIRHIFNFLDISHPSYLDIGAHHPFMNSNTAHFYLTGSKGVLVEPDPLNCMYLRKYKKNDVCIEAGISEKEGEMDYYVFNSSTLNTFSEEAATRYQKTGIILKKKLRIKVLTPTSIFEQHFKEKVPDFISLDVEGLEWQILNAMRLDFYAPKVICIETVNYSNDGRFEKNYSLINFVKSKGYIVYADTGINTIFILEDLWKKK